MEVISLKFSYEELCDILTTAVEGGIGYWSVVTYIKRDAEFRVEEVSLKPYGGDTDEWGVFEGCDDHSEMTVNAEDLQEVIDNILSGKVKVNPTFIAWIKHGVEMIDSDVADVIVQVALFGDIIYG